MIPDVRVGVLRGILEGGVGGLEGSWWGNLTPKTVTWESGVQQIEDQDMGSAISGTTGTPAVPYPVLCRGSTHTPFPRLPSASAAQRH